MPLEHDKLTERIIAAGIAVHKALGPGFVEQFYENAMTIEMAERKISFKKQVPLKLKYSGHFIGQHRVDIIVDDVITVELKAVRAIDDIHFATVRSYLKAARLKHGLILNFAKPVLEIKRVIRP